MGGLGDPIADGGVAVAGVAEGLVEDEVGAALDEDGVGAGESEDVDLVLPAGVVPVGRGVAVGVFVERIAELVERGLLDRLQWCRQDELRGAELQAIRGNLQVGDVLEIPVDAVEQRWDGGGFDLDVARGAGDAEGVGLAGVEDQVELRGEAREDAVQDGLGGRRLGWEWARGFGPLRRWWPGRGGDWRSGCGESAEGGTLEHYSAGEAR